MSSKTNAMALTITEDAPTNAALHSPVRRLRQAKWTTYALLEHAESSDTLGPLRSKKQDRPFEAMQQPEVLGAEDFVSVPNSLELLEKGEGNISLMGDHPPVARRTHISPLQRRHQYSSPQGSPTEYKRSLLLPTLTQALCLTVVSTSLRNSKVCSLTYHKFRDSVPILRVISCMPPKAC